MVYVVTQDVHDLGTSPSLLDHVIVCVVCVHVCACSCVCVHKHYSHTGPSHQWLLIHNSDLIICRRALFSYHCLLGSLPPYWLLVVTNREVDWAISSVTGLVVCVILTNMYKCSNLLHLYILVKIVFHKHIFFYLWVLYASHCHPHYLRLWMANISGSACWSMTLYSLNPAGIDIHYVLLTWALWLKHCSSHSSSLIMTKESALPDTYLASSSP